jgi:DNA-binding NarL/FixJ family response regulator
MSRTFVDAAQGTRPGSIMSGVLLVDDHPIVLSACRQLLERSGVSNILEAHDAEGAYQAFLEHGPDVVVIDLSLRGRRSWADSP